MLWVGRMLASARSLLQQLQSLGLAGVVAYGLLNTLYYTAVFSVVWMASKVTPHTHTYTHTHSTRACVRSKHEPAHHVT